MEKVVLSRKELYELVWSEPILSLSTKWGVPVSRIRSLCQKMRIPFPNVGYWQKLRHHKRVQAQPLPENYSGDDQLEIVLSSRPKKKASLPDQAKEQKSIKKKIKKTPVPKVSSRLENPDPLILAAEQSLRSGKGRYYEHGGLVWTADGQLDIRVSPKNIDRALRFMDALIKMLRAKGHGIEFEYGHTCAVVEGQKIEIQLKELMTPVYVTHSSPYAGGDWTRREYQATGKLVLRVHRYSSKEWKDGRLTLEEQLETLVGRLEADADRLNEEKAWREERRREQQEKARIEQELKEQREREALALKDLLQDAQNWQQANMLRAYIETVRQQAICNGKLSDELSHWLEWAQQKANALDPLHYSEKKGAAATAIAGPF